MVVGNTDLLLRLQTEVLEAVARGEQYGVWGGQLFEAGRIVIAKRRRGRPAKVPRPGDSLPEVAVPAAYQSLVVCA